ncbi:PCDHD2 [Acanthosepion pharaonis]|uniref:PCDHD2 n=1 Tax=Acanthosepion pharaonis TaxID=158019 RepID=A0A812BHK9_ACAPH|nr:PCDHD2 [Sepia pharaonis]
MCKRHKDCFKMVDVAIRKGTSPIKILEIKVIIQDVNDHRPDFADKQVNIQFSEGDFMGTKISIPHAMDRDVSIVNSQITYQLKKKTNEPFKLSVSKSVYGMSKLGITLEKRLDREVQDSYMIQVIAKDGGTSPKQSVLDVHISVTDVNDNFPAFSQNVYNVSIKNECSDISPVVILSATDLDSGENGRLTYHFSPETFDIAETHFKLNEVTGEIFLYKKFPLGKKSTYELYVEATDGGNPPLSSVAMVQVNLINQQNNAPTIDMNFVSASTRNTVAISEDIAVGSFIAYVKVIDHDVGQNGEISCYLYHDKFQLQNLGPKKYQVIVKNPLDRETEDHHDITISCQDKGFPLLHSESKFYIQVMDVNDVQPQFPKETYKFRIYENQRPKLPVGFINATDPDMGPGGKLTYSLLTNNKEFLPFQITDNGQISTVMSLDHEFQDIYKFQVFVKDNGTPSLNNTVNVIVEVRDKNDNAPYFTFPSVNPFTLDFHYYPHHTNNITVLRASDSDSRENAFLKYEIIEGNKNRLFAINHYTGLLTFTRVVTQYDAGTYDLQFVVKDSGTPVLSAIATLILKLTVSNKTYEMLNAIHIRTHNKIHLDFMIAIVLVAISASVIITASVSICILRCNSQRNVPHSCVDNTPANCEQTHVKSSAYLVSSLRNVPVTRTDLDRTRITSLTLSRRASHSGITIQTAPEVVYQEIGARTVGRDNKKRTFMVPGCHPDISHDENMVNGEAGSDQYSSQYSLSRPVLPEPLQNTHRKLIRQRFSCPGDSNIHQTYFYRPGYGPIPYRRTNLRPTTVNGVIFDTRSLPHNLSYFRNPTSVLPQLPSVSRSDYAGQVSGSGHSVSLPKCYILELDSQTTPPQVPHLEYSGGVEHTEDIARPKYYVLEPNSQSPSPVPLIEYSGQIPRSEELSVPKYYVLEPGSPTPPQVSKLEYSGQAAHSEDVSLPKYYVLEPNPQTPPQVSQLEYAGQVSHSDDLSLPKYYVLEPNSQTPPQIEYSGQMAHSDELAFPKYYVLEPNPQKSQQVPHLEYPGQMAAAAAASLPKYYVLEPDLPPPPPVPCLEYHGSMTHLEQLPLPENFILNPDSQTPPQVPCLEYPEQVPRLEDLPLPDESLLQPDPQSQVLCLEYPEPPPPSEPAVSVPDTQYNTADDIHPVHPPNFKSQRKQR